MYEYLKKIEEQKLMREKFLQIKEDRRKHAMELERMRNNTVLPLKLLKTDSSVNSSKNILKTICSDTIKTPGEAKGVAIKSCLQKRLVIKKHAQ